MADPSQASQQDSSAGTSTITTVVDEESQVDLPTVTLKLKKPKTDRKVQWTTETIDNEEMNKKKSKCCCIYKKPTEFGESSSSDSSDEDCDHCQGHVEKKKKKGHNATHKHAESNGMSTAQMQSEPQTITETIIESLPITENAPETPDVDSNRIEQPIT